MFIEQVYADHPKMRFTFTFKMKSGAVMTIEVEARDQTEAEEKLKRPATCAITKVLTN